MVRWCLVADAETAIGRYLKRVLSAEGFRIRLESSGDAVLTAIECSRPDVIVLGDDLPDIATFDLIAEISGNRGPPVLVLRSHASDSDVVRFLDAGAGDCLRKPFVVDELGARLRRLVRWTLTNKGIPATVQSDRLYLDFVRWRIVIGGGEVRLSLAEKAIFEILVENVGRLINVEALFALVWGSTNLVQISRVHDVIGNIRRKLELTPDSVVRILSERHVGYRLILPEPWKF